MKISPRTARNVLLATVVLLLAGCACFPFFWECQCRLIEFKPSMKIPDEKWAQIVAVLHRSDPSLYRIQYYKKGVLQKRSADEGTLPEDALRGGLATEVANEAKAMSYTGHALQAGSKGTSSTRLTVQGTSSTNKQVVDRSGSSSTRSNRAGNSSTLQKADCGPTNALVDTLERILQGFHK